MILAVTSVTCLFEFEKVDKYWNLYRFKCNGSETKVYKSRLGHAFLIFLKQAETLILSFLKLYLIDNKYVT